MINPVRKLLNRILRRKSNTSARIYHGIDSIRRRTGFLYYPIRAFFRLVIYTQHNEIRSIGVENIPPDGSVILVGNHPNSYLDYLNLINAVRHPVATAAKDTITNWFLLGPILRNHMLMVPIARKQDEDLSGMNEEDRRNANAHSMREAVELLVKGRIFNIFGEGRSTDSRKLNNIKLGFMSIGLQAEKEFNFRLNLRIVPFGYFYDRINKFQSSVAIVFGKPFKLNSLANIPDDFLSLPQTEQVALEKKIMLAGKQRAKAAIEDLIISIQDRNLVDLIDDATALYVLTPRKYMGHYKNIREKYRLSKALADSMQRANQHNHGKQMLSDLKNMLSVYRRELNRTHLQDALVRREHNWSELAYHLRVLLKGLCLAPLIIYGKIFNWLPHRVGRFVRYWTIEVKKRPKVDGDEQAIIGALISALTSYPIFGGIIAYLLYTSGIGLATDLLLSFSNEHNLQLLKILANYLQQHSGFIAGGLGILSIYLMARLWRFALRHGYEFLAALRWMWDSLIEILRKKDVHQLRGLRYEILDNIDYLLGEFDD